MKFEKPPQLKSKRWRESLVQRDTQPYKSPERVWCKLLHRVAYVGGKNFTMTVRSIPSGGGRTSVTFAKASNAD
jgi:hypothetical protein